MPQQGAARALRFRLRELPRNIHLRGENAKAVDALEEGSGRETLHTHRLHRRHNANPADGGQLSLQRWQGAQTWNEFVKCTTAGPLVGYPRQQAAQRLCHLTRRLRRHFRYAWVVGRDDLDAQRRRGWRPRERRPPGWRWRELRQQRQWGRRRWGWRQQGRRRWGWRRRRRRQQGQQEWTRGLLPRTPAVVFR